MKARDHDKIVRQMLVEHAAEKRALREQIETLKEVIEALRVRAQQAEQKAVEAEESWWANA